MRILESRYPVEDWARGMTPFEILISTILSQSTTVANERRGLNDLRLRVGAITPKRLAETPQEEIAKAIWHAGLAKQKAPRIRGVAKALLDGHGDRLERILGLPTERAREELMALRGVGPKTADVVLAMAGGHPTFAVDTHIARIARRWNLVRQSDYESIRAALERWTPPETEALAPRHHRARPHPMQGSESPVRRVPRATRLRLVSAQTPSRAADAQSSAAQRQRIKSAVRLAREGALGGAGLGV